MPDRGLVTRSGLTADEADRPASRM